MVEDLSRGDVLAWCERIDTGSFSTVAAGGDEAILVPTGAELDRLRDVIG